MLAELEEAIKGHLQEEDPISRAEALIDALGKQLGLKNQEIDHLKMLQQTEFVPIVTKEKIEESLRQVEMRLKSHTDRNSQLESELQEKQTELRQMEALLRDKEQQYQFLVAEFKYWRLI